MRPGEIISLTPNAIHEVHEPLSTASAALHVYGGPLFNQPRHTWNPREAPVDDAADLDRMLAGLRASGDLAEPN